MILLFEKEKYSKLFTKVLPYRWHKPRKTHIKADFHITKKDKVVVNFVQRIQENDYEIDFTRTSPHTGKQTAVKTGGGHVLEIYSTFLYIVKDFIIKHKPVRLVMWALEASPNDSRVRFYDRFLKDVFPSNTGYTLESRMDIGGSIAYVMIPKEEKESEQEEQEREEEKKQNDNPENSKKLKDS